MNVFKSQQVPLKSNYRALPTAPVHGVSTTNHFGLHGAVEAVVLYCVWRRGLQPPTPGQEQRAGRGARKLRQPPCVFLSLTLQVVDEWLHSKRRAGHGMVMVRCRHVFMVYVSLVVPEPWGEPPERRRVVSRFSTLCPPYPALQTQERENPVRVS